AGTGTVGCRVCGGRGQVRFRQGFFSISRTCSTCGGAGQIISNPCTRCRGEGRTRSERKLKLNIPPGVDNGTRLRLAGEGEPGAHNGPPGDLYVVLKVKEHPIFEREEIHLHCTIPVNVAQAALGTELRVPTLDGEQTVKVPPGTQHGAQLRLRGKGVPHVNGHGRGDLIVHVNVVIPSRMTKEQKKLFEELLGQLPAENQPTEKGIFERVKDYFGWRACGADPPLSTGMGLRELLHGLAARRERACGRSDVDVRDEQSLFAVWLEAEQRAVRPPHRR